MTPRILIIAGSDSGGGAGLQADVKTVTMLGGHAMTAVTAITAQDTRGVHAAMPVPTALVMAQIAACVDDIGVDAVKIGMLGSAETAAAVADWLSSSPSLTSPSPPLTSSSPPRKRGPISDAPDADAAQEMGPRLRGDDGRVVPVVFDPVMVATSGSTLADAATIAAFGRLMALATLVTPNLPEAEALGGLDAIRAHGGAVLLKGGHGEGDRIVDELVTPAGDRRRWEGERIDTRHTHGTGCTLASAIAVGLAEGMTLADAVARARGFVRAAILAAPGLGAGHGPMGHQAVRLDPPAPGA